MRTASGLMAAAASALTAGWLLVACNDPSTGVSAEPQMPEEAASADLPYEQHVDARRLIAEALARAKSTDRLVMISFGANWCPDCRALSRLSGRGRIKQLLDETVVLVHVDVGRWDRNLDIARDYGYPIENGIPALVIADADNRVRLTTADGFLANARQMTENELYRWMSAALKRAHASEDRAG